ncbi:MAG: lipopolysaccharide export system protein LptA [Gammaproteobacteria bacterium]
MKAVKFFFLLCLLLSSQVFAKTGDAALPIQVEADSLEVRDDDGISIYTGNVKLTQGSLEIHSDQLTLFFAADNTLTLMKMIGSPATFSQLDDNDQEITGEAREMEYRESKTTLLLLDNAKLTQGTDTIESNRIMLDTSSNSIQAGSTGSDNRVRMLILPKQAE